MKKDIFTVWLKEFCSLVFTQAVQAFLLAAIMSVVIATSSGNIPSNRGAGASATGIIAIIALTAVSKMELLVKKIFGIESQFGDPSMKSGMAGLAGTLIGARLAGRVLNNAGKIGSGLNDRRKAKMAEAQARSKLARDLSRLNSSQATDPTAGGTGGTGVPGAPGVPVGGAAGTGGATGAASDGTGGNATLNPTNLTITAGNVNVDGKQSPEEKRDAILDKYNEAIDKAKEQRRQGTYKALSGGAETIGGIAGGLGGAAVGLATGDAILQKTGVGMGIGDFVGESAVKTVKNVQDISIDVRDTSKAKSQATKDVADLTGKDISSYRSAVKELEKYTSKLGDITSDASKKTDAGNI